MQRSLRPSTSEPNLNRQRKPPSGKATKPSSGNRKVTKKTSKTLEDKRSSSSDHESDGEGTVKFLQSDLIQKIKKYNKAWFEETAKKTPEAVRGFDSAVFGLNATVFYSNADCLNYIDLDADWPCVNVLRQSGEVTVLTSSPDHTIIALAVYDESIEGGSAIRTLDSNTLQPMIDVAHTSKVISMCISQGGEALVALSTGQDEAVNLTVFDLKLNKQSAVGELLPHIGDKYWEVSFCPADEGILCCFGGGYAYLLRALNGYVDKFSQIKFDDATCHSWASDVTMAFGTRSASIRLYRETLALEVVELATAYPQLLHKEMAECLVVAMTFTIRKFAVQTQNGIVLVFPMLEGNPQWDAAISLVLSHSSLSVPASQILSFDQAEEAILCSSGSQLLDVSLRHVKSVTKDGGRMVTARHRADIVEVSISEHFIASLDNKGHIIVSSRATGQGPLSALLNVLSSRRVISYAVVEDAISIFFGLHKYKLFAVRTIAVTTLDLSFQSLEVGEDLVEMKIVHTCLNDSRELIALFEEGRIEIRRVADFALICSNATNMKKGITRAVFSDDSDFVTVLGKNDQIFCFDARSAEVVWSVETKLQFYTDIAHLGSNVYALNKRFGIARIRNGKELGTLSMHTSAIGYESSSRFLAGKPGILFLATTCGQLLIASENDPEEPFHALPHLHSAIAHLSIRNGHLVMGSRNGCVVVVDLGKEQSIYDSKDDLILWPYNKIYNFTHLLHEIDLERNMIRKETESFVKAYTERRDAEVEKMRDEFERSVRVMKERVKKIEEAFELSEQDKQVTIENLKKLYEDEFRLQETRHDTMIREQIKSKLREADKHKREVAKLQDGFASTKDELIESFHNTEQRLISHKDKLDEDLKKTRKELELEKQKSADLQVEIKNLLREFECKEENMNQKRKEEVTMLEKELWNEKATSAQLGVQRDRAVNEMNNEKSAVLNRQDKINELDADLKTVQAKCQALHAELQESKKAETAQRLQNKKITTQLNTKTQEMEEKEIKAHKTEVRLRGIEVRMDEISHCVYDARKLEHKILALLAFMNEKH